MGPIQAHVIADTIAKLQHRVKTLETAISSAIQLIQLAHHGHVDLDADDFRYLPCCKECMARLDDAKELLFSAAEADKQLAEKGE